MKLHAFIHHAKYTTRALSYLMSSKMTSFWNSEVLPHYVKLFLERVYNFYARNACFHHYFIVIIEFNVIMARNKDSKIPIIFR